jgi:hypothetical protein
METLALAIVLFASMMTNFAPYGFETNRTTSAGFLEMVTSTEQTVPPIDGSAKQTPSTIKIDDSTVKVEFAPGRLQ